MSECLNAAGCGRSTSGGVWQLLGGDGLSYVTLRQVKNHTAGLPALRGPDHNPMMFDWAHMVQVLEAEPLWWAPGTDLG